MKCGAVLFVVACSGTPVTKSPPPPPVSQAWHVAPERWTTAMPIIDFIGLDTTRAIALVGDRTWEDHGIQRLEAFGMGLAAIDLTTGAVTEHDDAVRDPSRIYSLVRAPSGKVIAFGLADGHTAAWQVDPQTLALSPLPMPDPVTAARLRVGVSFDNTKIALCNEGTTQVRDAATLAIVDTLTEDSCSWGFPGETDLDRPGPNGQHIRRRGSFWRLYTADDREIGEIRSSGVSWRGDGNGAIMVDRGNFVWMPIEGPIRRLKVPTRSAAVRPIPARREVVVVLGDHQVGFADPETGTLRTLEGLPRGAITGIAFRGDTVITGADTLRVWRAGAAIEAGPSLDGYRVRVASAGPTDPVVVALTGTELSVWMPGASTPPTLLEHVYLVDRAGDAWIAEGFEDSSVRAGPRDHLVPIFTPIHRYKPAWTDIIDVDAARRQILMRREQTYYLITPATKTATPLVLPCEHEYLELALAHFAPAIVGTDSAGMFRVDPTTGRVIGSLAAPNPHKLVAWVSADELAVTEERGRGNRIILWSPAKTIAAAPKLRTPVTSIAIDRERALIAIGHGDGSFEVEPLAELRARATAIDAAPIPDTATCIKPQPFDNLLDDGRDPD